MPTIRHLLEMIRFSHTLFALPFALASAVLAWRDEPFRWLDLVGVLVCMVLARSAAMGFNRVADRRFDAANPRTAGRHLPAGKLSVAGVALFTAACAVAFVAATLLFVWSNDNWLPFYLAAPVLVFIAAYSLTKRFTALSHFWLGASLLLAPLAAWIAITGTVAWPPAVLGLAVLCWVAGFDILYACQDVEFDRQAGLHSVPAALGIAWSLRLAMGLHLLMVGVLVLLGFVAGLGLVYFLGVGLVAALLLLEHWLVQPDNLTRVNQAFFQVNAVISVGLLVIVAVDVLVGS
jgi:4-hydroxybenzoate polyprenyltransferase